jgi:hypothetical protein
MKRIVLTVATSDAWYSRWFDISCREVGGLEPVTLGDGVKWEGFMTGILLVRDYLRKVEDPESTLVFLNDKYDIVFTNPLDPLFDRFEASLAACPTRHLLKISSEENSWLKRSHFGTFKNKTVNTGSMLATARTMLHIFETISLYRGGPADDQKLITEYLIQHEHEFTVEIDDNRDFLVFYRDANIGARLRFDKIAKTVRYHHPDGRITRPLLIHRPANADMDVLLGDIGYTDVGRLRGASTLQDKIVHHAHLVFDKIGKLFTRG